MHRLNRTYVLVHHQNISTPTPKNALTSSQMPMTKHQYPPLIPEITHSIRNTCPYTSSSTYLPLDAHGNPPIKVSLANSITVGFTPFAPAQEYTASVHLLADKLNKLAQPL